MIKQKAIIVDVDGTVAIRAGRGPFEWGKLETDQPNKSVFEIINRIASTGTHLIFISGRELKYHERTRAWLDSFLDHPFELYCRSNGDNRRDEQIKLELFKEKIEDFYEVIAVFDDRNRVVRMWRENLGIPCFQVADGDF